ncbi:MAG TPA: HypC/HybG/HupF family hydrogenase formation chaperone [Candidatus Marinimicrobia bacterium]|jgi:hydrogenase expression/formation protein HypC|nr:HypC/HybG/HupF family hydrogenase formation chaperone [Candidatus Neomarinimicrobiota bacterium]HPB00397.1 HypC/HybG/HupF family hydrogenase formation chaperone [Candidatus Neomarinimicrobiota bacterium]HPN74711.1 HypC/HybG/HupF family hydrogenase formation chaperone [Candidatus Neomarinimicrobiota bacterium]HPY00838.1 HypC/HybG/HupF family hydrogenase formation chaperone [Candidatus Neomarinimicrobiota bacterium]HQC62411.1 HypC/HybG/HupF family hydrogenase formation chaperone [Candidatus Ne
MCLAVPMRIIEIDGSRAKAEVGGVLYQANLDFLSDVKVGDYIIVHAGFAIEKLDEIVALDNLAAWQEVATDNKTKYRK